MSEKQAGAASALTNNSLIAAVLAATGAIYLAREAPLEKARPDAYEATLRSQGYHDIEARAWQDPLAAAEAHRQTDDLGGQPCDAGNYSDNKRCTQLPNELGSDLKSVILAVMVPGGSFSEDVETRRRTRYAVLAGLNREGYAPEDSQRLDYFRLPTDPKAKALADFPYEWFRRRDLSGRRVLVLWVNEEGGLLSAGETTRPKRALNYLFENLLSPRSPAAPIPKKGERRRSQQAPSSTHPRRIAVLGPWHSDTLLKMRNEPCLQPPPPPPRNTFGLKFYSYGASIPEGLVHPDPQQDCRVDLSVAWRITADDKVAKALVAELEARGLFTKNGTVAVFSDWDTLYGWGVAKTIKDELETGRNRGKVVVKQFSYLRGLDGSLASNQPKGAGDDKKTSDDRSAGKGANDNQIDVRAFERPYGPSQADYLRRIADDLTAQSREYDFRAIGVLGNDVYDKLWVLRALKPAFPNAIFFTTDYDAVLASKNDLPFTRNLVIASSYGAKLRQERQGDNPPFRSAYQTSAFLATQLALEDLLKDPAQKQDEPSPENGTVLETPHLFEITRSGQILELPAETLADEDRGSESPDKGACEEQVRKCSRVTEPLRLGAIGRWPRWSAALGLFVMAGWFAAVAWASSKEIASFPRAKRLHGLLYMIAVVSFLGAMGALGCNELAYRLSDGGKGEPAALVEGISLWPVILLRLAISALAFFLTWLACRIFQRDLWDLAEVLKLRQTGRRCDDSAIRRLVDPFLAYRIAAFVTAGPNDVRTGWAEYVCQGRWTLRLVRCGLWSSVGLFLFWLVGGFDAIPPMRSEGARIFYLGSLALNFLSASILTLFIFDATALCVSFVEGLGQTQTYWPDEVQRKFKKELGLLVEENAPAAKAAKTAESTESINGATGNQPSAPATTAGGLSAAGGAEEQQVDHAAAAGEGDKPWGLLDYWIDLIFIEKHTRSVNTLVYYPFVVIALSILAQSAVFAAYPGGRLIGVAEVIGLSMIFCCALALRWAAERARRSAEHRFAQELIKAGDKDPGKGKWGSKQLETLLDRIKNLDGGAFSPLLEQPFIKALLLPIGSFGWVALQDLPWTSWF